MFDNRLKPQKQKLLIQGAKPAAFGQKVAHRHVPVATGEDGHVCPHCGWKS